MRAGYLRDLVVQIRDPLQQTAHQLCDYLHHRPLRLDHRSILNGGYGVDDTADAFFGEFMMPPLALPEEFPQLGRRNFLQLLQRRPTLQEIAHQFPVRPERYRSGYNTDYKTDV